MLVPTPTAIAHMTTHSSPTLAAFSASSGGVARRLGWGVPHNDNLEDDDENEIVMPYGRPCAAGCQAPIGGRTCHTPPTSGAHARGHASQAAMPSCEATCASVDGVPRGGVPRWEATPCGPSTSVDQRRGWRKGGRAYLGKIVFSQRSDCSQIEKVIECQIRNQRCTRCQIGNIIFSEPMKERTSFSVSNSK
jgi:hypothetical protein